MKKIVFIIFIFLLLFSFSLSNGKIEIGQLKNGLKYVIVENHSTPIVSIFFTVKVGLRDENNLSCGVSHMLEHLLFNGTKKRTQKKLYEDTDMIGGYCNAFTRDDFTCFMMVVPSSNGEKGMEIITDMLFNSTLPPKKLEKERGIVIEELKRDMADPSFFYNKFRKENIFKGTPYEMEVLGTVDSIKAMKRENIWNYYITHYVPSNMVALIVGDISVKDAILLLKKYTKDAPSKKVKSSPIEKNLFNRKDIALYKVKGNYSELTLTFKAPFMKERDYFPFLLLDRFFNSPNSPLLKIARELKLGRFSSNYIYNRDYAIYNLTFRRTDVFNREIPQKIISAIKKIKKLNPTQGLLRDLKISLKAEEIYNYDNIHYLGVMKGQILADVPFNMVKNFFLDKYIENVESVSSSGINNIFQKYFLNGERPIVTIINGEKEEKNNEK